MPAQDAAFQARAEALFDEAVQLYPVMATYIGIHTYDHLLGDYSPEGQAHRQSRIRHWLAEFSRFDPAELSLNNRVDLTLVRSMLTEWVEDFDRNWHTMNPGDYPDSAIGGIYVLLTRDFAPLPVRMQAILARLEQVPELLRQGRRNIGRPPRIYTEIALENTRGGIGFLMGLIPPAAARVPDLEARVLEANSAAIAALQEYLEHLETDVLPRSDGEFALGKERFERRLQESHFLNYTADSLAAAGHDLIRGTLHHMERLAREIDPDRTWQAIVDEAKKLHPTAEGLLDAYRSAMAETRAFVLAKGLIDLPANEVLEVVETPSFFRALIPYAAYQSPPPLEEKQTGLFFVTPVDPMAPAEVQEQVLEGHNSLGIPLTALHEGYPGHHTQLCWANRNPSVIRRIAGNSTLFAEGWAFYCEELMESLGYLSDPRAQLLRLKDQLWRACRIVIDVGLHCTGMTTDEAAAMLVDVAKIEPVNARAEVARYTMSPTQPMSYLIGKLELLKLASEYRERKGAAFSLKQFHTDLLAHGTMPPALIRDLLFAE